MGLVTAFKLGAAAADKAANAMVDLNKTLQPLVQPGVFILKTSAILNICTSFASTVGGVCAMYNTYSGVQAQAKLISIYEKLGDQVKNIAASLESIDTKIGELVNHRNQHEFADHVHDFANMRSELEQEAAGLRSHGDNGAKTTQAPPSYLFIYHQGTEWWPRFHKLVRDRPIPNLCGMTADLDSLVAYMIAFREIVGPEPIFRILIPATTLFYIETPLTLPESVGKLIIEGETHNQTGTPYVHVNIVEALDSTFHNVRNIWSPGSKGWKRWMASTSAACAVGLPVACVATPAGLIAAHMLALAAAPLVPVALASGTAYLGAMAVGGVGGAAGGAISSMFVGNQVEKAWDRSEARRWESAQAKKSQKMASNPGFK